MYLSRFEINKDRRGARKLLGSPQAMHAAVLGCFPSGQKVNAGTASSAPRRLWRVDTTSGSPFLYVVSPDRPDMTSLVEQAGWPTTSTWDTRNYTGFLGSLSRGQRWAFRVIVNATKSTRLPGESRSQRVGHVTVHQQRDWLLSRSGRHGFSIPAEGDPNDDAEPRRLHEAPLANVTWREVTTFRRGGGQVTLARCRIDGVLTVEDADLLRRALVDGIGPAKAYGCGLMTLAPLR